MIAVIDYGSQYTQLIAKKFRKLGYLATVLPSSTRAEDLKNLEKTGGLKALVLSGSPASVSEGNTPDPKMMDLGIPILGICYGYQFLAHHFGGEVGSGARREYGATQVQVADALDPLLKGVSKEFRVWMSHGDHVEKMPSQSRVLLTSQGHTVAFALPDRKLWALQFHPEVHHSEFGSQLLENFAIAAEGGRHDWDLKQVLQNLEKKLRDELKGVDRVLCAVSGGVDSTVLAVLLSKVSKVEAVMVDHGFLRSYDVQDLRRTFAKFPGINLTVIDARDACWKELEGVQDPEEKRKTIGRLFIETFDRHAKEHWKASDKVCFAQGTIYSDVIESADNKKANAHKIKSHHNVGGLPERLPFRLIEPLREFFKDEVREIGRLMGLDDAEVERHPFPGPGLLIRCLAPLNRENVAVLQHCDRIFHEELLKRNLYKKTWQAGAILLPVSTVGVMGDGRTYEKVLALRAVSSIDAMTAEATEFPMTDLKEIASRIVNEVKGVNRVVYDLTSKPPATIEWE
jgi:GMP synthase (glutamine-hydrolysing)